MRSSLVYSSDWCLLWCLSVIVFGIVLDFDFYDGRD